MSGLGTFQERGSAPLDTPDRLVRGGALAALLALAATLLTLGLYFYRPTLAAAEPRVAVAAEANQGSSSNSDPVVHKEQQ